MTKVPNASSRHERPSYHLLPNSVMMLGVCLTGISLAKLIERQHGAGLLDQMLAVDSILFCFSTLLSYVAIRWHSRRHALRFERWADELFLVGMVVMTVTCLALGFDLI